MLSQYLPGENEDLELDCFFESDREIFKPRPVVKRFAQTVVLNETPTEEAVVLEKPATPTFDDQVQQLQERLDQLFAMEKATLESFKQRCDLPLTCGVRERVA